MLLRDVIGEESKSVIGNFHREQNAEFADDALTVSGINPVAQNELQSSHKADSRCTR